MKKIATIITFTLIILTGCQLEHPLAYENDPAIYFVRNSNQRDSLSHSFFMNDNLTDTVYIKVITMGEVSTTDRSFSVRQVNSSADNAAQPGIHYKPFNDPFVAENMVVKAGKAEADLPIIFIHDESLDLNTVELILEVESNENFRPGIDIWRQIKVTTTALTAKPALWNTHYFRFFGLSWGPVKFRFIIDNTGYMDWGAVPDMSFGMFMGAQVLNALQKYNNSHDEPLSEADGTEVSFTS